MNIAELEENPSVSGDLHSSYYSLFHHYGHAAWSYEVCVLVELMGQSHRLYKTTGSKRLIVFPHRLLDI